MAYRHNDALHKHQKRASRLRIVAVVFSLLFLVGVAVVSFDWIRNQISNSETVVSSENSKVVQSANVSVHRTEFFQFQAPEPWIEIANETPNRFEYVKNNGNLITQKLTVIVDRPETNREADFKLTRVLPIDIDDLGNFNPANSVSEHCNDSWPEGLKRNPSRIDHDNVSFVCAPSSQQYNVVVGVNGGSDTINVVREDGSEFNLFVVFSDLTAYPSAGDIYNIVSSFRTL